VKTESFFILAHSEHALVETTFDAMLRDIILLSGQLRRLPVSFWSEVISHNFGFAVFVLWFGIMFIILEYFHQRKTRKIYFVLYGFVGMKNENTTNR
jgi:hypothetical protein